MELLKPRIIATLSLIGILAFSGCSADTSEQEPTPAPSTSSVASTNPAAPVTLKNTDENYPLANGTCINPDAVARYSAESVGRAYIGVSYCWDSTVDAGMHSGTERARPLMSQEWAETALESEQGQRRNTLQYQFAKAAEHQAYTRLRIYRTSSHLDQHAHEEHSGEAENSSAEPERQEHEGAVLSEEGYETAALGYTVYWDWVGRDGTKLSGGKAQVMVYLENRDDGWTVVGSLPTLFEES